jgi:hypothetical protein
MEEILILENLAASNQKKAVDKEENPKKLPEQATRINEPEFKYVTHLKETVSAQDVVQTAMTAKNPVQEQGVSKTSQGLEGNKNTTYQNHPKISKSADFEDSKPYERPSIESKVPKVLEVPIMVATQELLSISPDVRCPKLVKTKQISQTDQAATTAFVEMEEERKAGGADIVTKKVTRGNGYSIVAGKVENTSYELFRPISTEIQVTHHQFSDKKSNIALDLNVHPVLTIPTRNHKASNAQTMRGAVFVEVDDMFRRREDSIGLQTSERDTNIMNQDHVPILLSRDSKGCKPKPNDRVWRRKWQNILDQ